MDHRGRNQDFIEMTTLNGTNDGHIYAEPIRYIDDSPEPRLRSIKRTRTINDYQSPDYIYVADSVSQNDGYNSDDFVGSGRPFEANLGLRELNSTDRIRGQLDIEEEGDKLRTLRQMNEPLKFRRKCLRQLEQSLQASVISSTNIPETILSKPKMALNWITIPSPCKLIIKRIEGQFGSAIGSYFRFLQFQVIFNVFLLILNCCFILVPQLFIKSSFSVESFKVQDIFTAGGSLESQPLFYKAYTNGTTSQGNYQIPHAYFYTIGIGMIVSLIIVAAGMASSCRRYFIDIEASNNTKAEIAKQVFTGWDFAIAQKGTKDRKQRAALVSLQETAQKISSGKGIRSDNQKYGTWILRVGIWIAVGGALAGAFTLTNATLEADLTGEFYEKIAVAFVVTLCMTILPLFFTLMTKLARYGKGYSGLGAIGRQRSYSFYATLLKTMLLQLVLLACLASFYIQKAQADSEECWELEIGQELYRLLIFFFIILVFISFSFETIWNFLQSRIEWIRPFEFDIARETTLLIYGQTVVWLGMYFSPLLPGIYVIILMITFIVKYVNLWLSVKLNRKSTLRPWMGAQNSTVFMVAQLLSLIGATVAIAYVITRVPPSRSCGPFTEIAHPYSVLSEDEVINKIPIFYPVVAVGINIFLVVLILLFLTSCFYNKRLISSYKKEQKIIKNDTKINNMALKVLRQQISNINVRKTSSLRHQN